MTWPICSRGSATYGGNRHRSVSNSKLSTGYSLARADNLRYAGVGELSAPIVHALLLQLLHKSQRTGRYEIVWESKIAGKTFH